MKIKVRVRWQAAIITWLLIIALIALWIMGVISAWIAILIFTAYWVLGIAIESFDQEAQKEVAAFIQHWMQRKRDRQLKISLKRAFAIRKAPTDDSD